MANKKFTFEIPVELKSIDGHETPGFRKLVAIRVDIYARDLEDAYARFGYGLELLVNNTETVEDMVTKI